MGAAQVGDGCRSREGAERSPLQPAEVREDLVALVLHLPVNARDRHALHQGLQGLPVVLHAGAGAAGRRQAQAAAQLSPTAGEGSNLRQMQGQD